MKNNNNLIAKRYAESLIELAQEGKTSFEELSLDLNNTKEILNNSKELYDVLTNPIISAKNKEEVIEEVFKKDVHHSVSNFLKLLVSKNRFDVIYRIIEIFGERFDEIKNIQLVEVTCAIDLEDSQKEEIQNKLKEKLKKEIKINYSKDPNILAGLVYKMGDDVIDTSLAHKLEQFKKEITK